MDIDAVIGFLRRSWRLCAIWIGAGLCAGLAFLLVAPAYYTAYATIVLYDGGARPVAVNGADAAESSYVDTQIEVLQSDEVVGKVVDQYGLIEDPEFGAGTASKTHKHRQTTIVKVAKALRVARVGTSEAVNVGFTAKNPGRAAELANAIVHDYILGVHERQRQQRADTVAEIRDRLTEIREKAFASEPPAGVSFETPQSVGKSLARFREQQDNSETYRAIYNNLLQQANTALFSGFAAPAVRVITSAEPPIHRSWPRAILVFGIAIIFGGLAGFGQSLLREVTDRSLRTTADLRQATGLDSVAVPAIEAHQLATDGVGQPGLQPAYTDSSPEFSRALVRLGVKLRQERGKRPLLLGVAAADAGTGASTAAAHLASMLAEAGEKTLLVDANWRKPADEPGTPGSGRSRTVAGIAAVPLGPVGLEPGRFDVLRLRAATPLAPVGASLMVLAAVQQLPPEYDCAVVDFHAADETPDLEASVTALDGVVVIAESGRTNAESLHSLLSVVPNEKITAVILNKVAPGPAGFRTEFARFAEPFVNRYRAGLRLARFPLNRHGTRFDWARSSSRHAAPVEGDGLELDEKRG